jgi:zinc protease
MRFATAAALAVCALVSTSLAVSSGPAPRRASKSHAARPAAARPKTASRPAIPASALDESHYHVERHTLGNGLVVLLHEDHSVPAVTFWQWFRVGSRDEHPGITGISHVFEHMMFNGSKNVPPKEYDRRIESNGGTSNASTDRDVTSYSEDIASDRLEVLFELDSDRMRGLTLEPAVLAKELEVVKEERRLRVENDIAGLLDEKLYATAFLSSPYRWPVIGWQADLERLQRKELLDYFRVHYAPNNCLLVLTGDFEPKSALALIQKYFGDIPSQPAAAAPVDSERPQPGERRASVAYPSENAQVDIGYKAPSVASGDVWVLDVLSSILSDGESSRLHRALVYEQQIALSADTFFRPRLSPSLFEFYLEMKPGHTATEGEEALDDVLDRLIREGPTERELQKARNLLQAELVKSLKTNHGAGEQIGFFEAIYGNYRTMFSAAARYGAVTAEDCRRVAAQVFVPEHRTVVELAPIAPEDDSGAKKASK